MKDSGHVVTVHVTVQHKANRQQSARFQFITTFNVQIAEICIMKLEVCILHTCIDRTIRYIEKLHDKIFEL